MATFTKRISANLEAISDKYNSHWSPTWIAESFTYGESGQIGKFQEDEVFPGEWSGGIRNASYLFKSVTIPQGATITSAKITFIDNSSGNSRTINFKFIGVDEDNTGDFVASPLSTCRTRVHTTASVDWDITFTPSSGTERDSPSLTSIIQEIVDRGGWSSGNTIGIYLYDDGSVDDSYYDYKYYSSYPSYAPLLTVTYEYGGSASVSPSASASPSKSPSASYSPSSSQSVSMSPSVSSSPSPSPGPTPIQAVLKVGKSGVNVLTNSDPEKFKFTSEYGTLKYFLTGELSFTIDGDLDGNLETIGVAIFDHNLGYYPYVEVYVLNPIGQWEYCPTYNGGASTAWQSFVIITSTQLKVYAEIAGFSSGGVTFYFKYFIYKNDLAL